MDRELIRKLLDTLVTNNSDYLLTIQMPKKQVTVEINTEFEYELMNTSLFITEVVDGITNFFLIDINQILVLYSTADSQAKTEND